MLLNLQGIYKSYGGTIEAVSYTHLDVYKRQTYYVVNYSVIAAQNAIRNKTCYIHACIMMVVRIF